jgi:hypothetical protein
MERRSEVRLCIDSGEEEKEGVTWGRRFERSLKNSKVATRMKLDELFDVGKEKKTEGLENPAIGTQGRPNVLEMPAELTREPAERFREQCEQALGLMQKEL